jgi:hypothetical protein
LKWKARNLEGELILALAESKDKEGIMRRRKDNLQWLASGI